MGNTRANYQAIYAKYKRLGKGNVRLTQSTLILSKPINPNVATYNFDVLETQTATLAPNEIRLNLNDEFIMTQIGLYLEATIEGAGIPTGAKKLFTYAPAQLDGVSAANLQNFYAGQLQISVNNIIYLDKFDSRKHEFVPRTQILNAGAQLQAQIDSVDFSQNSMFGISPLLTLSGAKKNQITLSLPSAITASSFTFTDDKGSVITYRIDRIVCLMRGLNAQNGSVFQGTK